VNCATLSGSVSLALCMLLHRYVEQPGIAWGKRWLGRRARVLPAASG
jgi:peptidoglycan/LPS O-acetylase OafA/YrhL